jgi:3-carboxy-cis,cis-muconate cycloisomerase
MPPRLIDSLSRTEELAEVFSDHSVLQATLQFEVALARVQERLGIIPRAAAEAIAAAADSDAFDLVALSRETLRAGTPGISLVKALTDAVRKRDSAAAGFVHWGTTSQDVADTALVLLLKKSWPLIEADLIRIDRALAKLAEQHRDTVMLGRTLLQSALPVTFGLKAASWFAAVRRGRLRLQVAFEEGLVLQFGGAAGTLAALGQQGSEVAHTLAAELGLTCPDAPWHTQRDRLAGLASACGVLTGSLGKMARDISLLMQTEVGEAFEAGTDGRGGSSTMPHKHNPIGCAVTLAASTRMPGLVASYLSAMVQEHERGTGGWQAEWTILADVMQTMGVAAASSAEVVEGLTVDKARMRQNLEATLGIIFAEKAAMILGKKIGRDAAHRLLEEATRKSVKEHRQLKEVLAGMSEVTEHLDPETLSKLDLPEDYLGSTEIFRAQQLGAHFPAIKKD